LGCWEFSAFSPIRVNPGLRHAQRASGNVERAERLYRDALRLDDACQPCLCNYANLLAAESKPKEARRNRRLLSRPTGDAP